MNNKQPEALRLADRLENGGEDDVPLLRAFSAAELRRLHAVNAELLEALQVFAECNSWDECITITVRTEHVKRARAAIYKATGSAL